MEPRNPNTPNTKQTASLNTPPLPPPHNHHISTTLQRGPIKIGSSTHASSACAACKYQRKKCLPDCKLAPYFPPTHQTQFLNTHKLFGVSNLLKVVNSLDDPIQKEQAMKTMIFQAEVRANDPVGGCYRLVCELNRKIELHKAQLSFVLNQLAVYRAQGAAGVSGDEIIMNQNMRVGAHPVPLNGYSNNHISHQLLLQQMHENQDDQQQQQLQYYNMIQDDDQVLPPQEDDEEALNQLWTMENFGNNQDGVVNMMKSSSSLIGNHKLQQQQQESFIDPDVR